MRFSGVAAVAAAGLVAGFSLPASAQDPAPAADQTAQPAPDSELPPVEVIQKEATPAPKPVSPPPQQKQVYTPAPQPQVPVSLPSLPAAGSNEGLVNAAPLPGSAIPIAKMPRGVSTMNASDIERDGSVIPQELLNNRIPSVMVDDLQGNQFQTGIQYRGFEASPVNGLPQGLAVYQNGIRINEAFGDTVNWDFLPTNAIAGITVMGANPIYGLNAIGGAIGITMKDGFMYQGAEVDTRFGSFGRKQVAVQAGASSGNVAIYGAFEGINDDGFRDFSGTEERRGYADLGFKGTGAEFHLTYTGASSLVGVTAAVPEELLAFGGDKRTFTSPQITDSKMQMFSASGVVDVTPTMSIAALTYYRHFRQSHIDGNISEFEACDDLDPTAGLCTEEGEDIYALGSVGTPIDLTSYEDEVLGSIDKTGQDAESFGVSLQGTEKAKVFGFANQFILGSSYDHGRVAYTASSELGTFLPKYVVKGTGITLTGEDDEASEVTPRSLTTTNDYVGVYALDTIDLTDKLALTVGARWNYARIQIENTGEPALDDLNGTNEFYRLNPSAGLTYEIISGLSAYGGYAEANRAPTASEIACSDPENPCIIESALASDPPLKQVVSRTWETGLRGSMATWNGSEHFDWSVGLFRTMNEDDIIQIADSQQGRGYFANAGKTLRQGLEASATYRTRWWQAYATYSYVDATFESRNIFINENNPNVTTECDEFGIDADDDDATCMEILPGDRIAGVPQHRFKAGVDVWVTPKWMVGGDLIAASSQYFYGDEANLDAPLSGYARVNLRTAYNVTEKIQLYGLIENLFDSHYGVYGTYFNTELAQEAAGADPSLKGIKYNEDNARTITPAIPFAIYGGAKVRF